MIIGIDISRANTEQRTGVEQYVFYITNELKKIIPSDARVILYCREVLVDDLATLPDNWEVKVLSWPPKRFWTQLRLSIEMFLHAPDVLFIPGHVFPLIRPKHTIMTVHDIAAYRYKNVYSFFERWYSLWSAKKAVKKLSTVIVPSIFTKNELITFVYKNKHKKNNIVVIPHGFECTSENSTKIKDAEKKITKPFLLFVGRIEEKKNVIQIISAFNEVKKTQDVQLVLVGKHGYGYQAIDTAIADSMYHKDIIQLGYVSDSMLHNLYATAQVFVFPSLYEGFGLPILEAMSRGCPVVCSNDTALPEVGGDAIIRVDKHNTVQIAQAIISILQNKTLQDTMRQKGYAQIKKFSWKLSAQGVYACIASFDKK